MAGKSSKTGDISDVLLRCLRMCEPETLSESGDLAGFGSVAFGLSDGGSTPERLVFV